MRGKAAILERTCKVRAVDVIVVNRSDENGKIVVAVLRRISDKSSHWDTKWLPISGVCLSICFTRSSMDLRARHLRPASSRTFELPVGAKIKLNRKSESTETREILRALFARAAGCALITILPDVWLC